jgi:hypothetical protein
MAVTAGMVGSIIFFAVIGLHAIHFNALTGVYTYDPRREQPNGFFLSNKPDEVLVQTLTQQIATDGSYPAGATQKIIRVEPIRVEVSTYSDWAAEARVTTRLTYQDGAVATEVFRFRDAGSNGMVMPIAPGMEMSIHARFGRLAGCQPDPPAGTGASYCGLDMGP